MRVPITFFSDFYLGTPSLKMSYNQPIVCTCKLKWFNASTL